MWQELLQHGKGFIVEFCRRLRGADRRAFQAEVATEVCGGSPRRAESMFGWSRKSVEKGLIEQQYDVEIQPHFARRGRRACEVQSPVLADVVDESLGVSATLRAEGQTAQENPGNRRDFHPSRSLARHDRI